MEYYPEVSTTKPYPRRIIKTCTFGLGENTETYNLIYTIPANTEEQNGNLESDTSDEVRFRKKLLCLEVYHEIFEILLI